MAEGSVGWGADSFGGLRLGKLAGGCPAASYFLLLRQKKVTKEKATLPSPKPPKPESAGGRRRNSARFI